MLPQKLKLKKQVFHNLFEWYENPLTPFVVTCTGAEFLLQALVMKYRINCGITKEDFRDSLILYVSKIGIVIANF